MNDHTDMHDDPDVDVEQTSMSPHAWKMIGAVGLSSMMAATGILLLGGFGSKSSPQLASGLHQAASRTRSHAPSTSRSSVHRSSTVTAATAAPQTLATSAPATTQPACTSHYVVRAGDSWSLIAAEANITLDQLLSLNHATASSGLYPNQSLCIPAGTSVVVTTTATPTTAPRQVYVPVTQPAAPTQIPVSHSGGS